MKSTSRSIITICCAKYPDMAQKYLLHSLSSRESSLVSLPRRANRSTRVRCRSYSFSLFFTQSTQPTQSIVRSLSRTGFRTLPRGTKFPKSLDSYLYNNVQYALNQTVVAEINKKRILSTIRYIGSQWSLTSPPRAHPRERRQGLFRRGAADSHSVDVYRVHRRRGLLSLPRRA